MRISSVTQTCFGSFYHGFIRVDKEYHDVSNKAPKKKTFYIWSQQCAHFHFIWSQQCVAHFHFISSRQCAFPFHLVTTVCAHFHFDDFPRLYKSLVQCQIWQRSQSKFFISATRLENCQNQIVHLNRNETPQVQRMTSIFYSQGFEIVVQCNTFKDNLVCKFWHGYQVE